MQVELLVASCKLTRIATRNTERRRCVADLFLGRQGFAGSGHLLADTGQRVFSQLLFGLFPHAA